jgi:hypothetical protein
MLPNGAFAAGSGVLGKKKSVPATVVMICAGTAVHHRHKPKAIFENVACGMRVPMRCHLLH